MPQLSFAMNYFHLVNRITQAQDGTMSFIGWNLGDSISLLTLNVLLRFGAANQTHTGSLGLYSLNVSTLSLANYITGTFSNGAGVSNYFVSLTGTSSAQNIGPGTWYWGLLFRTGGANSLSYFCGTSNLNPANAFPGALMAGAMTESTAALPSSYATSNLDTTGSENTNIPYIVLSA